MMASRDRAYVLMPSTVGGRGPRSHLSTRTPVSHAGFCAASSGFTVSCITPATADATYGHALATAVLTKSARSKSGKRAQLCVRERGKGGF